MTPFFLINTIFVILINFSSIWLGTWVYLANRKAKANRVFLIMAFFVVLWVSSAYFCNFLTKDYVAHFWAKMGYGAGSLFLLFVYLFSNFFPREEKRYLILNKLAVIICLFLFFFSIFTNFVVKEIVLTQWGTLPILGNGQFIFLGLVLFLGLLFIFRFLAQYFRITREEKLKTQYLLIGLFIFIIANLIFNIILPLWQKIPYYYHFGNYSAIFLLAFTAYAIVKRELFGIRVVLTQILVGVIAIVLLVQALGSATIFEYIWKGAVFVVFLFFGFLLIRSVMREIKLREALQQAYAKLQVLDKAKSEFISIASHQLRTPLTAIKGYISMILEGSYGEMPEKAQRPVENVYKSAERLINLVNDLLSVSRLEAGKIKVEPKKVSIEEMILGIIEELKIKADEKKIYLKFQQPLNPLPKVIIDPDKIRQVILNIIDNAIRYTTAGGITVETGVEGPKFKVVISDTGEGMTREEISNMFESFSRGTAGGRLWTEGSGLGLYVARRFVEMHQGKVWVESEGKGKGSTFFIELPRRFGNNEGFDKFMKAV